MRDVNAPISRKFAGLAKLCWIADNGTLLEWTGRSRPGVRLDVDTVAERGGAA